MKYLYYPGCSLKGQGKAYEKSLMAVFGALGVELVELEDWNCCGATACVSVNEVKALAVAGRNLAIAERMAGPQEGPIDLIAPCSACFLGLTKANRYIAEYPEAGAKASAALEAAGLPYSGNVRVRHPLDVLVNDIGLEAIKAKITQPITELKVAPYYGCQIVRPYSTFDDQHDPVTLDKLLELTGAQLVEYPLKTKCCGGSITGVLPEVGASMVYVLLKEAHRRGADMLATICPLCQFNLDGYTDKAQSLFERGGEWVDVPVVYFTQLLGLAMGIPASELDLQRNMVPAVPVLAKRGVAYA